MELTQEYKNKILALNKFLEREEDDQITEYNTSSYDDNLFEVDEGEYLVLTDKEADEYAYSYIRDTVWAFNKSFLDSHSEAIAEMDEEVFSKIQEMCESANKTILRLIEDINYFMDDAISCDGRGHFLSGYDGEEHEIKIEGEWFYIYRTN